MEVKRRERMVKNGSGQSGREGKIKEDKVREGDKP